MTSLEIFNWDNLELWRHKKDLIGKTLNYDVTRRFDDVIRGIYLINRHYLSSFSCRNEFLDPILDFWSLDEKPPVAGIAQKFGLKKIFQIIIIFTYYYWYNLFFWQLQLSLKIKRSTTPILDKKCTLVTLCYRLLF